MSDLAPPLMADPVRAARVLADLGGDLPDGPLTEVLPAAVSASTHLGRCALRRPETLRRALAFGPLEVLGDALRACDGAHGDSLADVARVIRQAKQDVHLAVGLGDLAGVLSLDEVTGALSDLADAAVRACLAAAAKEAFARGELASAPHPVNPAPGFIIVAMGKWGARELNYSSDIDFTAFYDPGVFRSGARADRETAAVRLIKAVVRALEEVTVDGYAFRTDLRLRPDPRATPPAMPFPDVERYYESVGQNWERASLIKARAVAGDLSASGQFLQFITSFIWRRNLDYAAIADIQSIMRQIHAHGRHGGVDDPDFDVKLGRGGIREIEFFAQVQQLILGGRFPWMRSPRTLQAIAALEAGGAVPGGTHARLAPAYHRLRAIEHRIQMLDDEQTHRVPREAGARLRLARFAGFETVDALDAALIAVRRTVHAIAAPLHARDEPLADPLGSLVFTGVDDDPETLETLGALGFSAPGEVAAEIRDWHRGHLRATRAQRGREILTRLMPRLLRAMSDTGEPDAAFARFVDFFRNLAAGVQVLSLFEAQPGFLRATLQALALSPRLAEDLGRRPETLDAMVEARFAAPLARDDPDEYGVRLTTRLSACGYEEALNITRRFRREEAFRIGFQLLTGQASPKDAGVAYARLAQACIAALVAAARAEVERLYGRFDARLSVAAFGKLAGGDMTETSDLDIVVVYEPAPGARDSHGARPLSAETYFLRLTQRIVSALSAPTEEGLLYTVDMALRPAGSKGPLAVRRNAFSAYYEDDAWTWELMALTRLRAVAGDADLGKTIEADAEAALKRARDPKTLARDVADMRMRMARQLGDAGPWDLKLAPGGLVDLEFLVQFLLLRHAGHLLSVRAPAPLDALERLTAVRALTAPEADALASAGRLLLDLQHVTRLAVGQTFDPATASAGLRALIARCVGAPDFAAVERRLEDGRTTIRAALVQALAQDGVMLIRDATENAAGSVQ
jgi:glutamate-ammonia-ligase adenylyltransferase